MAKCDVAFEPGLCTGCVAEVIENVRLGHVSMATVQKALWAAGCLSAMIPGGGVQIRAAASDCPVDSTMTVADCAAELEKSVKEHETANPPDAPENAKQFNPVLLFRIFTLLMRIVTTYGSNQPD